MSTASLTATGVLASELHAFLRETDPARWTESARARAMERWHRIRTSIEALVKSRAHAETPIGEAVEDLAVLVRDAALHDNMSKSWWMEQRGRLMPAYERLAISLRAHSVAAPTLRPTNWSRIGFHISSGLGALVLLELVLTHEGTLWATGIFAGVSWALEISRSLDKRINDRLMRVRFFQRIIHPHEHQRVNSATWYATALVILAGICPIHFSAAALAVLAIGDPLAGIVGRRFGRHSIANGRTLEGTVAFALGGGVAALLALWVFHPTLMSAGGAWVIAFGASIAGALAEALSRRIDDNFAVPLAAAAGAWLASMAIGLL